MTTSKVPDPSQHIVSFPTRAEGAEKIPNRPQAGLPRRPQPVTRQIHKAHIKHLYEHPHGIDHP
jgi:hypothetical protein